MLDPKTGLKAHHLGGVGVHCELLARHGLQNVRHRAARPRRRQRGDRLRGAAAVGAACGGGRRRLRLRACVRGGKHGSGHDRQLHDWVEISRGAAVDVHAAGDVLPWTSCHHSQGHRTSSMECVLPAKTLQLLPASRIRGEALLSVWTRGSSAALAHLRGRRRCRCGASRRPAPPPPLSRRQSCWSFRLPPLPLPPRAAQAPPRLTTWILLAPPA